MTNPQRRSAFQVLIFAAASGVAATALAVAAAVLPWHDARRECATQALLALGGALALGVAAAVMPPPRPPRDAPVVPAEPPHVTEL